MAIKKHMNKQGISPLIATVLIIGFTVALAAIIINWGTGFTRNIQQGTESTTDIQITCAQDVVFDIVEVCNSTATDLKVTVSNDGSVDIANFIVRISNSAGQTVQQEFDTQVPAFNLETDTVATTGLSGPATRVQLIPRIALNGQDPQACSSNTQTFEGISSC